MTASKRARRGGGSVRERGPKTWLLVYDLPAAADGQRRQKYVTHKEGMADNYPLTKTGAHDRLADLIAGRRKGNYTDPATSTVPLQTFEQFVEVWLSDKARTVRPQTVQWYRRMMFWHVLPVIGHIALKDVDAASIRKVLKVISDKGLAAATERKAHTCMVNMLDTAILFDDSKPEKVLKVNPARLVKAAKKATHKVQPPSPATVNMMLAATAHLPYGAAFRLLAYSGARRGEIAGLKWSQVDFATNTINIAGAIVRLKGDGLTYMPPKTDSSNRAVNMDEASMEILRQHRMAQLKRVHEAQGAIVDEGWCFTAEDGTKIDPQQFTDAWRAAAKRLSVDADLHSLRHAHATLLLRNGVPVKEVSARLGHSSVMTTLDIYSHVMPGADAAAVSLFAQVMKTAEVG